jgi:transketolase
VLARFRLALTVEAHYVVGGVGSLVSEVVAQHGLGCRVVCRGVQSSPVGVSGSQSYMYGQCGISSGELVDAALRSLAE